MSLVEEPFTVQQERYEDVSLYKVLPDSVTWGTAYFYYLNFSGMEEEIYYLLQCATRQDSDPERIVQICQDIVDFRNQDLLRNFGKPNDTIELDTYELPDDTGISELEIREPEAEQHPAQ